ncbi:MAG: class I SAM-dependent methyltransferase [Roseovarius sp.]
MLSEYIDLNNMIYFGDEDICSAVDKFSIDNSMLTLTGTFTSDDAAQWKVVAADKYRRFLAAGETSQTGEWSLTLDMKRLQNLPAEAPLVLWGLRPNTTQIYPVAPNPSVNKRIEEFLATIQKKPISELPSHQEIYIRDIVEATKVGYVSTSIQENIITGNNYQSLSLKKTLREGTRTDRNTFLRQVDFTGKSVLDIGANTGEMSRSIRLLGADLVDGVEYDSFFVETGRMINGAVGATRVSLFQGDATHPGFYKDKKYDIVVALSVYVYIKNVMKELAEMTDVLVFETHTLDHGLQMYLDVVLPHFPVYQHVGYSQMSDVLKRSRAFVIFAKDQKALESAFKPKTITIDSYFDNKFFSKHKKTTPKNFLKWANDLRGKANLDALNQEKLSFGSSAYFETYIIGYLEYLEHDKTVTEDNIFVRRYVDAVETGNLDQKLKPVVADRENTLLKVTGKYKDLDYCLAGELHRVPLIYLALDEKGALTFTDETGQTLTASNIDGHHRYFIAQILGIKEMMCMVPDRSPKFAEKIKTTYSLAQ